MTAKEEKIQYEVVTLVDAKRYNFQSYVFKQNVPTKVRIGNAAYLLSQTNEDTDERFFSPGAVEMKVGKKGRSIIKPVKVKEDKMPYMMTRVEQVYNAEKVKMEAALEGQPDSIKAWIKSDFLAKHGPKKDKVTEA